MIKMEIILKFNKITMLIASLLIIFLLCSCNKSNSNFNDDIDDFIETDDISEEIDTPSMEAAVSLEEAISLVKYEVQALTGLDDVETSELFSMDDKYYIKVKIHDLMLREEYISVGDDKTVIVTKYSELVPYSLDEASGDFYEIWKCENGDIKRLFYNMEEVVYSRDDEKVIIDGPYNSYIIKLDSNDKDDVKILYECYFTHVLDSDNGDHTCYINDFYSVCVADNRSNEIILNKFIEINDEYCNEDYKLDNNRIYYPKRMSVMETGWIKDSNMAYFACYDLSNIYIVIDIDKRAVFQPYFKIGFGGEGYIDKNDGYIIASTTHYALDVDSYMYDHMVKQYNYYYLINLYTLEQFEVAKSIMNNINLIKEDDKTFSYVTSAGDRVKVDISELIGKQQSKERELFKETLYTKLRIDEDDNVKIQRFNENLYAVVGDGETKKLIQYTDNKKINAVAEKLSDINFSENGKYISLYKNSGELVVLDNKGNKYFECNVFDYVVDKNSSVVNIDLGVTVWGKNGHKLYILTKNEDKMSNIFEVNMTDKSIRDLAHDIDCLYENLYIDILHEFVAYSTFPASMHYSYDDVEINDDVYVYVKYFNPENKVEVASIKDENIKFYIFNNKLEYYCYEDYDFRGSYIIFGDGSSISEQEDTWKNQLMLNGISLTKDIIHSVYRGYGDYTCEVLLFALAVNNDKDNLYKGYFPFEEHKGYIFTLDKSKEVLTQVFGERDYSLKT